METVAARARARTRRLAWTAAGATYALIVLGGVVRITGAGLACGEDWPLCNGRPVPTLDLPTLLEYTHRLAAAGVTLLVLALAVYTLRHREEPGMGGAGGPARPAGLALGLLVGQVLLGAVTVRLALPSAVVSAHLVLGMAVLAALLVAALRLGPPLGAAAPTAPADHGAPAGVALGATALGFLVVALGAFVANTGAAPACQGFPLCNGQLLPAGGGLVQLHWAHRLLAYLLTVHVAASAAAAWRRQAPRPVRAASTAAFLLVVLQVGVAGALVWSHLPDALRALHLALGTALWASLVLWASLARRATTPALPSAQVRA